MTKSFFKKLIPFSPVILSGEKIISKHFINGRETNFCHNNMNQKWH